MEDRESLKRQIALLQNLIDSHKSVHGDAPSRSSQWEFPLLTPASGRGQGTSFPARTRPFASNPVGHWRKKYSLSNQRNAHPPSSTANAHPPSSTTTALPSKHNDSSSTHLSTCMAAPSLGLPPQACRSAVASHSRPSPYPAPAIQKAVPSLAPGTPNAGPSLAPGTQKAGFSLASGTQKTGPSLATGTQKAGSSQALGTHKPGPSLAPRTPKTGPFLAPGTQKAGPSLAFATHKAGPSLAPRSPKTGPSPAPGSQKPGPCRDSLTEKVVPSPTLRTEKADPSQGPGTGLPPVPGRRAVTASRMSLGKWSGRGTSATASSGSTAPPEGAGRGQAGQVTPVSLALGQKPQSAGEQEVGEASVSHRKSPGLPGETGSVLQLKPRLQQKIDSAPKLAALISNPPPAALARTIITAKGGGVKQRPLPSRGKSRFSWVKGSQGLFPNPTPFPGCTSATPPAPSGPLRKSVRQPGGVVKTSKYTWVSSSSARLPRKPLSPKAVATPHRTAAGGATKKGKLPASLTAKHKKCAGSAGSSHSQAHSSRYCWKAVGQNRTDAVRGGSVYRWTSEKENGPKGRSDRGTPPSRARSSPAPVHAPSHSPSSAGFRLRSPMKIIRRRSSNSIAAVCPERRSSPSAALTLRSRYALRRRTGSVPARSPACSRKVLARGLVSISRHKLRRLSPAPASTSSSSRTASSSPRYTVGQRVIKTRYKIITRRPGTGPAHNTTQSSTLTWRAKRLQSARALLQSRLRTAQPWRGRDMRWIGGTLYRVSANKLCRTGSTSSASAGSASSPRQRAGKPWGAQDGVGRPLCGWDPSRAVQRSLAIVRQAKQRKQQQGRQYCMYYNRFGKCNRGQACPYIHDPDKVAVCTRFLRGTCKQTDGSCPFSHKVSKEKMPVCSYFLRGICNNNNCPYSHVYVSRSAGVCQDFVRGYCPKGEKCKQKHTLVCPDFSSSGSCPRGSKCKLQHRQRLKRTKPGPASAPPKRARTQEAPPRSEGAEPVGEDPAPPGPAKLPSFISLLSSPEPPEEEEASDSSTAPGSEVTERKLQIKPRF